MKIHLLDELTINQIAAGEVIENSASIVKELVENALDSGATSVSVETKENRIHVADNGCGMDKDDLLIALERHATSKIAKIQDLYSLSTLGFRGEALASIVAVSHCIISSSADESGMGNRLEIQGGVVKNLTRVARQRGTTVEIDSLFFNVPVRRRFQKSFTQEAGEISKALALQTLSRPHVQFSWAHQGKLEYQFADDCPLLERIKGLFGVEFANALFPLNYHEASYSLSGFISKTPFHRPNRTGQYLFVNGRAVTSPFVSHKFVEGYGTRLPVNRFPYFVLFFDVPCEAIDVNIHPQKKAIKWHDEKKLSSFLLNALDATFQQREKPSVEMSYIPATQEHETLNEPLTRYSVQEKIEEIPLFKKLPQKALTKVGKYLLLEEEKGIRIVDTARVRTSLLCEMLFNKEREVTGEPLLFPITLEFTEDEKEKLLERLHWINTRGIAIRYFGGRSFLIDALPATMDPSEAPAVIRLFLESITTRQRPFERGASSLEEGLLLLEKLSAFRSGDMTDDGKLIHMLVTEEEIAEFFKAYEKHGAKTT